MRGTTLMRPHEIQYYHLVVSPPPHIHAGTSYTLAMYTWAAALMPAAIYAVTLYGMHAVRVMSFSMAGAMCFELIIQKLFKQPVTTHDGTALCTGLLFAMILPPGAPWWLILVGTFIAILIGRQIYGGVGGNPMNPVLIGWAAVRLSWGDYLSFDYAAINYHLPFSYEYPLTRDGVNAGEAESAHRADDAQYKDHLDVLSHERGSFTLTIARTAGLILSKSGAAMFMIRIANGTPSI